MACPCKDKRNGTAVAATEADAPAAKAEATEIGRAHV